MPNATETLGLIGAGLLGSALAERFLAAGFAVTGYDPVPECRRRLSALGAEAAESVAAVAAADRIILCLPNSGVVASVLDELAPSLKPASLIIDTTTGDPQSSAEFGRNLASRAIGFVDAAVGGSSATVRRGDAIVMAGGADADFGRSEQILRTFALRVFHVGPCGSGACMKLVNNLVLGLNRAVLAEGLAFAKRSGLDPALALEVLQAGPAWSRAMEDKGQKMLNAEFSAQARLAQHLKDVRLILEAARNSRARVPLSTLHCRLLEEAVDRGLGEADNSAIFQVFEESE
ncbi:MAG TPA: NAD(P)-dependent oxidoreductase [Bryobacteraceae bacterium]|nr:NAD(P)-dependent oxidoreductase [Bryobacteraceae bacterium]